MSRQEALDALITKRFPRVSGDEPTALWITLYRA